VHTVLAVVFDLRFIVVFKRVLVPCTALLVDVMMPHEVYLQLSE